jgi:hypothetical protein
MTTRFTNWLAALALGTLMAIAAMPTLAAPVNQTFSLIPDFGPPALGGGSFSYDDSQTPTAQGSERLYDLTSFSVELPGISYSLLDLDDAFAVFDASGFIGLQVTIDGVLTLSPAHGGQDAFFAYAGLRSQAMGDISFATVDEPGVLALLLLALAGASGARRRRAVHR